MKTFLILIGLLSLKMCEKHYEPKTSITTTKDRINNITSHIDLTIPSDSKRSIEERMITKNSQLYVNDYELQQTGIVVSKELIVVEDLYELNYRYPYLDDEHSSEFNAYLAENYLNIEKTTNQILDDKEQQCNVLEGACDKDVRHLDYSIFSLQEELLSVVLYQENYYAGAAHSAQKFDCLNFDLNKGKLLTFNDIFIDKADVFVFEKLNQQIRESLKSGELFSECWELDRASFLRFKSNFVVNEDTIRYYFDDCVICPYFTGKYFVDLPMDELIPFLNIYSQKTLVSHNF